MQEPEGFQTVWGRWKSLGPGQVLRVLPTLKRRTVGPFVFVDHMGGQPSAPEASSFLVDVAPHPHIGIATVTYLFEGAIFHRDSIGSAQLIEPGAVNWMSSGRGIVHSERTPEDRRKDPPPLFGVQSWVALPRDKEDGEPFFHHVPADDLPVFRADGATVRLIAGTGMGMESPVRVASPLVCAAIEYSGKGSLVIPADHAERGLLLLSGAAQLNGETLPLQGLAVLREGATPQLTCEGPARLFLIGGPPLPERRYLDWNFCSTSPKRIEEAKDLYRKGALGLLPEDGPNLPLPEDVR